jgi:hypothetical protein
VSIKSLQPEPSSNRQRRAPARPRLGELDNPQPKPRRLKALDAKQPCGLHIESVCEIKITKTAVTRALASLIFAVRPDTDAKRRRRFLLRDVEPGARVPQPPAKCDVNS